MEIQAVGTLITMTLKQNFDTALREFEAGFFAEEIVGRSEAIYNEGFLHYYGLVKISLSREEQIDYAQQQWEEARRSVFFMAATPIVEAQCKAPPVEISDKEISRIGMLLVKTKLIEFEN